MSGWIRRLSDDPGLSVVIELPHLHVSLLRIQSGERTLLSSGPAEETAVVFASGRCAATAGGRFWANAGTTVASAPWTRFAQTTTGRGSGAGGGTQADGQLAAVRPRRRISAEFRPLTSTTPWPVHQALWLPPDTQLELQALEPAEVVLFGAALDEEKSAVGRAVTGRQPEMYGGDPARSRETGSGAFRRLVTPLLSAGTESIGLAVGETYNPPGGWSTYPPHRHDRRARRYDGGDGEGETQHQEVYVFRFAPAGGFGLARLYEERPGGASGNDQALVFRHGDALVIPQGYHTVCGAPGYHLHYLWALAGPRAATPQSRIDPEHRWVEDEV